MDNDEDNSIRHYQLDDGSASFLPRAPTSSLFKRGNHGMCRVLTLSSLVFLVVMMIMVGVVGLRKRRQQGRRQRQRCIKRRGQCGRRKEEEFTRGGDEEEEEFAKKCFVYNQNFEKGNWNFDALERGLGVVREEEGEEKEEEEEEVAGKNGNQNQNGRPLELHHHYVSLKAPVIVDLEDV